MILNAWDIYEKLSETFPEIRSLKIPLDESFNSKSTPGKYLDLANTIFECVGKSAWSHTRKAPSDKEIEKSKLPVILTNAKKYFSDNDLAFNDDIYDALIKPAGRILGHRNVSGDISHGHLHTKVAIHSAHAEMCLNLALTFASYYLHILELSIGKLSYDDQNEDGFNEWLNSQGSQIGGASYSWLLYLHDYDAYEAFFDEYQSLNT